MLTKTFTVWCFVGLFSLPALADTKLLTMLPAETGVVVRIAAGDALFSAAAAFADQVSPGSGSEASSQLRTGLGAMLNNPTLNGVDTSRDIYVAVIADRPTMADVVLIIPATNASTVLTNLRGANGFSRDGWVFASFTTGNVEALIRGTEERSVLTGMDHPDAFQEAHLAVYVNIDHLVSTYEDQIDLAMRQVDAGLNEVARMPAPDPQVNMQAVADIYRGLLDMADNLFADGESFLLRLTIHGDALEINKQLTYRTGSPSANELAGGPDNLVRSLARLPAGMPIYFATSGEALKSILKWSTNLSVSFVPPEKQAQHEETMERILSFHFGAMSAAVNMPDGDHTMTSVNVIEVEEAEEYRTLIRAISEELGNVQSGIMTQTTSVEVNAETYGDLTADLVLVEQKFAGPMAAQQERLQRFMFGEEGMMSRMIAAQGVVISSTGGGRAMMEQTLQSYQAGNHDFSAWSAGILDNPNFVLLLDLPALTRQFFLLGNESAGGQLMIPRQILDAVRSLKFEPSYLSASTAVDGNSILGKVHIPASQFSPMADLMGLILDP